MKSTVLVDRSLYPDKNMAQERKGQKPKRGAKEVRAGRRGLEVGVQEKRKRGWGNEEERGS